MVKYDIFKDGVSQCNQLLSELEKQVKLLPYEYQIVTNNLLNIYQTTLKNIIDIQFDVKYDRTVEDGVKSLTNLYILLKIMYDINQERINLKSELYMKRTELKNIIKEEIQKVLEADDIRRKQELADVALDIVSNQRSEDDAEETVSLYGLHISEGFDSIDDGSVRIADEFGNVGWGDDTSDALYDWALNVKFAGIEPKEIDEISTTGDVAGYQTPNFLTKSGKTNDKTYKVLGYQDVPKKKLNTKPLSEIAYNEYKNDPTFTQRTKVQRSINQINGQLFRLEQVINQNLKLKSESGLAHTSFNESAKQKLSKIKERLIKLEQKIRDFGA